MKKLLKPHPSFPLSALYSPLFSGLFSTSPHALLSAFIPLVMGGWAWLPWQNVRLPHHSQADLAWGSAKMSGGLALTYASPKRSICCIFPWGVHSSPLTNPVSLPPPPYLRQHCNASRWPADGGAAHGCSQVKPTTPNYVLDWGGGDSHIIETFKF